MRFVSLPRRKKGKRNDSDQGYDWLKIFYTGDGMLNLFLLEGHILTNSFFLK